MIKKLLCFLGIHNWYLTMRCSCGEDWHYECARIGCNKEKPCRNEKNDKI